VVYQARHLRLKRPVALKMLQAPAGPGGEARARFSAEAEAAATLQHPNIVQVYELGEHAGRPFLALEYVAGGTLAQRCGGLPQPQRWAAELVRALALAMQHAHQRGVVHRDLKPANILLTLEGTPKVSDFGLAKRLDRDGGLTRLGGVFGTPQYMAPEQARGKGRGGTVGPAADIWALGAILYELLTGRPPFAGDDPAEVLRRVVEEKPEPLRGLRPDVALCLKAICRRCLHKDPRQRYQSARALAEELGRYLAGEPVQARLAGRAGRLARVAAVMAVCAGLVVLLGYFCWQAAESPDTVPSVAPRVQPGTADRSRYEALAREIARLRAELEQGKRRERELRQRLEEASGRALALATQLKQAEQARVKAEKELLAQWQKLHRIDEKTRPQAHRQGQ
jgi:serine/threonine-protein kinase